MLRSSQHIRPIWSRNFHQTTTFYGKQLLRKLRDDDIDPLTIRKHQQQQQQQQRRNQRKKPSEEFETKSTTSYNLKGALKVLQNQYDSVTFRDLNNNKPIDIQKLTTQQIKYSSPISKLIFKNLMQVKKLSGRQINRNLALALLGTDGKQLQDSYYICENVKELLKIDNDIERAMYLCQISDKNCSIVGSNEILQWLLSKGKINQALKLFSKRKSSGIPTNLQTYVILFHGIAKAIPWGDDNQQKQQGSTIVNEELFNRVEKIFKNWRLELATNSSSSSSSSKTVPIEVFNACLSVLVKDFRDEQVRAWDFFNELMANPKENLQSINPDSKTFTIFLKGIKKYFDNEMEKIMINNNSPTISNNECIIRLLDIEAGHIKTSQKIFERAKQLALPPLPTTSNNGDPELDSFNIHKWNKEKIELDSPLIVSYVSLLCNGGGGGGIITNSTNSTTTNSKIKIKIKPPIGSHYLYNEKALSILKQSSPEIDSLLKFVQQVIGEQEEGKDIDTDSPIIAKKSFKSRIDRKINLAIEQAIQSNIKLKFNDKIKNLDPYKIANLINDKNFNPEVIMPTKNSKNFNGLQPVPLIDFTREIGRANNHGMTKFLLMPLFDSLTNMGKLNEFVIAFWYAMIKWGGLRINLSIFNNNNNNNNNTTTTTRNVLNGVIKDSETLSVSNMAAGKKLDRSVIDEVILGIFINKITEYGREKGLTKTHLIMELFQTLISKDLNPPPPSLVGKDKDKDRIQIQFKYLMRIWWAIHDDLEYYHAYNQNNNNNNNSNNNNNKVDDKDLRFIQLEQFLKNLIIFNDINYQWSRNLLMKKLIPDEFIDQINRILIRLNHLNWFNIGNENENENKKIYLYKLMLKSSIKLLIPQRFITAKKNGNGNTNTNTNTNTLVVVSTYPKLMEQEIFRYIFVKLSKTDNLTDNNIKLLMALKKYRKAKPYNDEEAEKLFKETTNAIYDAIEIGDTKLTKSDIKEEEEENKVSG